MSDNHGTCLSLKRHEDLAKVAAYIKRQVRDKSIEQVGKDLSDYCDDLVGLHIDEDKNNISWHDYGHQGNHLDFDSIAESVIKEFPGVEMECQQWYGPNCSNYAIVDGEWQEYTLWQFVAYIDGKCEEVQLEYKEPKDGRIEEEKHEERDKMCKEIAERISRLHPNMEIGVYAIDWYENDFGYQVEEFYRAKDGRATKECVDCGLTQIHWECIGLLEWVESRGHVLLHPMEFATELIKRAREGDYECQSFAIDMLMDGDTASDTNLIGPTDKEWLMELIEERRLKREEDWGSKNDDDELPR